VKKKIATTIPIFGWRIDGRTMIKKIIFGKAIPELRNIRLDPQGDWQEDARDSSKVIADLERRCTYMEMERNDKSKSIVVDKLLRGTYSPFTRRVVDYQLPEKFKVPQILSYAGDGDPLDHLDNFWSHLDLHGSPDEVVCRAFPLTLSGNARDWFRKLPPEFCWFVQGVVQDIPNEVSSFPDKEEAFGIFAIIALAKQRES
jgi:hypothetical protein